ncbi:MAG: hypothetical protein BalsKO_27080 [Balneolaceae bacterium]
MKSILSYLTIFTISLFLFNGCFLKSVHPLVTADSAIILDEVEGVWETEDQRWTFVRDPRKIPTVEVNSEKYFGTIEVETDSSSSVFEDESLYLIIFENLQDLENDTTFFVGRFGDFEGNRFLDLSLLSAALETSSFKSAHLFGVHTFSRIDIRGDLLTLYFFKEDWIKRLIMENRIRIKHERVPDINNDTSSNILITASTDELQKFIEKYGGETEAFDDPIGLKKVQNES